MLEVRTFNELKILVDQNPKGISISIEVLMNCYYANTSLKTYTLNNEIKDKISKELALLELVHYSQLPDLNNKVMIYKLRSHIIRGSQMYNYKS